ncbi:MAG TPA: endonuclease V [Chloroflexia bacterium]|nr:endonuclease V [Chloroflexia bacterium]
MDLPTAVQYVLDSLRGYRLPEPTRQAHNNAAISDV